MKNIFTLLLCLLVFGAGAQELDVEWKVLLGGSDTDAGHSIINTSDGGFMVAASSDSQDGDIVEPNGDYDIWLIKLSHSGQVEWSRTYGGSDWEWPNSVIQTSDGGYLVVGFTYSDDGDIEGFNGFRDGWVIKVDKDGVLQWQRAMGGSEAGTIRDVIEVEGGFIAVGHDHSTDGDLAGTGCQNDFWIVKLDLDGVLLWQTCYGGSDLDFPTAISSFGNDQLLIAGYTESDDGDVEGYHDSYDYWIVAVDLDGTLAWQKPLGGSSWDQAFDVAVDGVHGRIYIIGETLSDDGDVSVNYGDLDQWLVCLDFDGQMIYEKSYGGSREEYAKTILLGDLGNELYIIGSSSSTDGDVSGNHGNHDMWVVNTDFNGVVNWNKSVGGTRFEQVLSATHSFGDDQLPNGIVLVGHTNSNDGDVEGPKGSDDVWVVKLGDASTSVYNPLTGNGSVSLFPNPSQAFVTISSDIDNVSIEDIAIYDVVGRRIMNNSVDAFSLTLNVKDKLSFSGVYFVEVMLSSGHRVVKRMVLE
jgi:hypothetical protein